MAEAALQRVGVELPAIRRFDLADLPQAGPWLMPRLVTALELPEQRVAGWLRSMIDTNEHLFLWQPHSVALAELQRANGLADKPIVRERFVLAENPDDITHVKEAAAFYDEFKRWAKNIGAEISDRGGVLQCSTRSDQGKTWPHLHARTAVCEGLMSFLSDLFKGNTGALGGDLWGSPTKDIETIGGVLGGLGLAGGALGLLGDVGAAGGGLLVLRLIFWQAVLPREQRVLVLSAPTVGLTGATGALDFTGGATDALSLLDPAAGGLSSDAGISAIDAAAPLGTTAGAADATPDWYSQHPRRRG